MLDNVRQNLKCRTFKDMPDIVDTINMVKNMRFMPFPISETKFKCNQVNNHCDIMIEMLLHTMTLQEPAINFMKTLLLPHYITYTDLGLPDAMQYINRHHFIQRSMGPDPFLQMIGEFRRCMNDMLKFQVFQSSQESFGFLGLFKNFGRRGHPVTPFHFLIPHA